MRKLLSCLPAIFVALSASSQWSLGAGVNYTHFNGREMMSTSTPGFHTRILYQKGAYGVGLTYNYHLPFAVQNSMTLYTPPNSWGSAATEIQHRFQTLDILIRRTILGDQQSSGQLYGGMGASWVRLSYKEKYMETYTLEPMFDLAKGNRSGFTANGLLGGALKLGYISLYGEATYSLPRTVWAIKDSYYITPSRLGFQLGVKLPLNP